MSTQVVVDGRQLDRQLQEGGGPRGTRGSGDAEVLVAQMSVGSRNFPARAGWSGEGPGGGGGAGNCFSGLEDWLRGVSVAGTCGLAGVGSTGPGNVFHPDVEFMQAWREVAREHVGAEPELEDGMN